MNRRSLLLALFAISLLCVVGCNREAGPCRETTPDRTTANSQPSPQNSVGSPSSQVDSDEPSYQPQSGYVPDEQTAVAIALAVWTPIYGKQQIEAEKPFKATLKDGVWRVEGASKEPRVGSTAIAEIAQNDGRIIRVLHWK